MASQCGVSTPIWFYQAKRLFLFLHPFHLVLICRKSEITHFPAIRIYPVHRIILSIRIRADVVVFLAHRVHRHEAAEAGLIHARAVVVPLQPVHHIYLLAVGLRPIFLTLGRASRLSLFSLNRKIVEIGLRVAAFPAFAVRVVLVAQPGTSGFAMWAAGSDAVRLEVAYATRSFSPRLL